AHAARAERERAAEQETGAARDAGGGRPVHAGEAGGAGAAQGRAGLFTINRLINRVSGHHPHEPAVTGRRVAPRADTPAEADDEDAIPAFLRRQAN
ncbi:MAG: hypothetical protein ACFBWO_11270, partial [Paracoccaceae bacterium]